MPDTTIGPAFRYYGIVPGMLADLVFELGIALALLGTVSRRAGVLVLGAVVAAATRQTALLALPVLALWLVTDRRWPAATRRALAGTALVVPFVAYGAVKLITSSFTRPFAPEIPGDTILHDLADLPSSASTLVGHSLRVLAPRQVVLLLLVVSAALPGRTRGRGRAFWTSVSLGVVISLQAEVISPSYPGFDGNEPRISSLGLIPFVVALAVVLPAGLDSRTGSSRWLVPLLLALLALASLHHIYTAVGPRSTGQFLALQVVVALAASAIVARLGRRRTLPAAASG